MPWLAVFFYLYALGTSAGLAVVPFGDLGRAFFRFGTLIPLAFAVVASLIAHPLGRTPAGSLHTLADVLALGFLATTLLAAVVVRAARRPFAIQAFRVPISAGVLLVAVLGIGLESGSAVQKGWMVAHLLTSSSVLGLSLAAMFLGHWYLQNMALSFDILIRVCRLLVGATVAKLVVSAVGFAPEIGAWLPKLTSEWDGMLVLVRIGAGLIGSLVLAFMALSCARARSNQSATGILYVAVVVTLVGELISIHLTLGGSKIRL